MHYGPNLHVVTLGESGFCAGLSNDSACDKTSLAK